LFNSETAEDLIASVKTMSSEAGLPMTEAEINEAMG